MTLSAKLARETWRYDPKTGHLWWRSSGSGRLLNRPAGTLGIEYKYWLLEFQGQKYFAHRVAWLIVKGKWPEFQIDHKNTVRHDNRWNNLRKANHQLNARNRKLSPRSTSGFKGVNFKKDKNKWRAILTIDAKQMHLGYFSSKKDAHVAYATAAKKHFGEFARVR